MKAEEALNIARNVSQFDNNKIIQALQSLANLYVIKKRITSYPNALNQKSVDAFFKMVDEQGIQDNFRMIEISKVREAFSNSFIGEYLIPNFPFISEEISEIRKKLN